METLHHTIHARNFLCLKFIDSHYIMITKHLKRQNQQKIPTIIESRRSFGGITAPDGPRKPSREQSILENIFKTLDRAIVKFLDPPLHLSVNPSHILADNFAPVDEISPTECEIVYGSIPLCLDGAYIRNGPNPQFYPSGPYHYFDGDGMVHCLRISHGRASFCSRYVKTNKYLSEKKLRSHVVPNVIGGMHVLGPFVARVALFIVRAVFRQYDIGKGFGVANTSLSSFGGRLYALCESGLPYEIRIKEDGDIITFGQQDFNGNLSINMTAHPKIDPETKEAFAFRYWVTRPFMTYFHFDEDGNKQPDVPIFSMKQHSLTHDLAITKRYAIIFDIQLGASPMNLVHGGKLVSADPIKVPKIGFLPRYAMDESNIKWFDVPGLNILHAVNAWDDIDEDGNDVVVLVAPNILSIEHFLERVDLIKPTMEEITINFGTSVVSRHTMLTDNLEFPVVNPTYVAKKNRYVYVAMFEETPIKSRMMRMIGVAKLDIAVSKDNKNPQEHTVASRIFGDNCFGGEPCFIAREPEDPNAQEDDGYVVSYVHDEGANESRFLVMDAQSPTLQLVAVVKLPQRVPYGLHGTFLSKKDLSEMSW